MSPAASMVYLPGRIVFAVVVSFVLALFAMLPARADLRMRGHRPKPREQFSDSLHENPPSLA
jgi:hypothetical protein